MVEERGNLWLSRKLKPDQTHLADSLTRLASSPSDQVSDFPLGMTPGTLRADKDRSVASLKANSCP